MWIYYIWHQNGNKSRGAWWNRSVGSCLANDNIAGNSQLKRAARHEIPSAIRTS